jgi:predicted ribosomally synthesized peptide with SipW-like signal peptide
MAAVGLAVAAALSVGAVTTGALLTDSDQISGNTLSTGNVDIAASPATAVLTAPGMAPGDVVAAPLTVSNSGTAPLRYSMSSVTSEDLLAGGLAFEVRTGVSNGKCTGLSYTSGTTLGTNVYGPGVLGAVAGVKVIGDPAQGAQSPTNGGVVSADRTLASGASESLCLIVKLPTTAPNALASKTTTATFTLNAEQTTNNP